MTQFITKALLEFNGLFKDADSLNWTKPSLDLLAVGFFLVVIFLVAFGFGKTRILLALVSVYIAAFVESAFSYSAEVQKLLGKGFLNLNSAFWTHLAVFFIVFVLALFVLNRSILRPKMSLKESSPFAILFLSILFAGLTTSIVVGFVEASKSQILLSTVIAKYFATKNAYFVWAILPLVGILFLKRNRAG